MLTFKNGAEMLHTIVDDGIDLYNPETFVIGSKVNAPMVLGKVLNKEKFLFRMAMDF